jgi:hypothetical protein
MCIDHRGVIMTSRTRLGLSLAAAALLTSVAACDGGSDDSTAAPNDSSAPGPTSGPETSGGTGEPSTTGPTSTPSTSEFTGGGPTQNPNGSPGKRAKKSQIPADQLPGFNDTWTWEIASEGKGDGDTQPSLCMLSPLTSIGAASTYRTDYKHKRDKDSRATVITAVFPDQHTAVLAKTVLRSWQAQCQQRLKRELGYQRAKTTKIQTDSTDVGPGEQWLSSFGPVPDDPDATWFQAEGFVEDADTLSYIVIVNAGQDYNYDTGQQPIDLALMVAGEQLKASRA